MYKGVECQSLEKDEDEEDIFSKKIEQYIENFEFILDNIDLLERCLDAAKVRGI
jgi:hypothetical protein